MSTKRIAPAFVPEEVLRPYVPSRRLYDARFSVRGERALSDAITKAYGSYPCYWMVMCAIEEDRGVCANNVCMDDAKAYLAEALGIDWRQFEHNVPKLPTPEFRELALRTMAHEPLPKNEILWSIQRKKWTDLWRGWVKGECERLGCEKHIHHDCGDRYAYPNFWELALECERIRVDKAAMLNAIDLKPKGLAVKVANDALSMIISRAKTAQVGPDA